MRWGMRRRLITSSDEYGGSPGARRRARLRATILAAALYTVAAILMTLPVWSSPTTESIGIYGDPQKFMGFLAWFPFAVTHGQNPIHMTWIDLPTGINAMWDTTMPVASFAVWPVRATAGIVAAYNAAEVGALALNGLCTFLWLRRHTRRPAAAALAGLLMVVGPYAASRAYGHLNLLLFFAVPLMLVVLENIVRDPRNHRARRGVAMGVLAAIQLLCTEEVLALAAVALVVAVVIAAVLAPRAALRRFPQMVPTGIFALAGFAVVGGIPLAYQFLGPSVPHGALPPHDVFVNDVLNFVIPTQATAISLGGPPVNDIPKAAWTGNPVEWNAYIGIPLLLTAIFTAVRWGRDRWLVVVTVTTLAVAALSLGPHLHVNGVDHRHFPLPEALLDHLPVFNNILPNRFSVLMDLGLAAILAVFIDHVFTAGRRVLQLAGAGSTILVAASMWPSLVPAATNQVPAYFQGTGDVNKVAPGTVALVFPIPYVGGAQTAESAVWQAVADFRFKMVSGASISVTSSGAATFGSPAQPLRCVTDHLQTTGSATGCATPPSAIISQLHSLGTRLIIVGPTANLSAIRDYFTALTGSAPTLDQGVLVWTI